MMDFSIYCQHKSNFVNFLHWAWNTIQRGSYIFTICIPYRHSHLLFSVASSTRSAQGWRFYSVQIKKKQKQNSSEHAGIYIYLTPPPLNYEWKIQHNNLTDLLKFRMRQWEESSLDHWLKSFPRRQSKHGQYLKSNLPWNTNRGPERWREDSGPETPQERHTEEGEIINKRTKEDCTGDRAGITSLLCAHKSALLETRNGGGERPHK